MCVYCNIVYMYAVRIYVLVFVCTCIFCIIANGVLSDIALTNGAVIEANGRRAFTICITV